MRLSQRLPDIHSCNNRSTTENKRKHENDGIELVIYIVLFGHLNVCLYVAKNEIWSNGQLDQISFLMMSKWVI